MDVVNGGAVARVGHTDRDTRGEHVGQAILISTIDQEGHNIVGANGDNTAHHNHCIEVGGAWAHIHHRNLKLSIADVVCVNCSIGRRTCPCAQAHHFCNGDLYIVVLGTIDHDTGNRQDASLCVEAVRTPSPLTDEYDKHQRQSHKEIFAVQLLQYMQCE